MARLSVAVHHIAAIREMNRSAEPDPVAAAVVAELAGADGIACHIREDRRIIKEKDVYLLKELVKTHLTLRITATDEMVKLAIEVLPDMVTLVKPVRDGVSAAGSVDVSTNLDYFSEVIQMLRAHNIAVCTLIDPDVQQAKAAARLNVDYIELNARTYARADNYNRVMDEFERLRSVIAGASKLGLGISVSGGLNYQNIQEFARLPGAEEFTVGSALINKALLVGMEKAVRDFKALL